MPLPYIGRMVGHILPKGFQRIRYYGLHATSLASKVRGKLKVLLDHTHQPVTGTYRVTGYRNRIKKSFGIDPLLCPNCGNGMELEGIWHPGYGWIVDNWNSFFVVIGEGGEDRGPPDAGSWPTEQMAQLQMQFM